MHIFAMFHPAPISTGKLLVLLGLEPRVAPMISFFDVGAENAWLISHSQELVDLP